MACPKFVSSLTTNQNHKALRGNEYQSRCFDLSNHLIWKNNQQRYYCQITKKVQDRRRKTSCTYREELEVETYEESAGLGLHLSRFA